MMPTLIAHTHAEIDNMRSVLDPEYSERTHTEADDVSRTFEDLLTLFTDPLIMELSFYNDCGHTEIRIYARQKRHQFKLRLPNSVPVIDSVVFVGALEEGYTHKTLETFYRQGACPSCRSHTENYRLFKLSARTIKERRILWDDFTSSFKLSWQYACQEELNVRAGKIRSNLQIEKRILDHSDISKPKCLAEIESLKRKAKEQRQTVRWQRKMYRLFNTFNNAQNQSSRISKCCKIHLMAPGYDTKLLAPAAEPTKENKDDNCSICLNKLYTGNGRVRSLPCRHNWHHECIAEWLRTENTCPVCRKMYNVLAMPNCNNLADIAKFQRIITEQLESVWYDDSPAGSQEGVEGEVGETGGEERAQEMTSDQRILEPSNDLRQAVERLHQTVSEIGNEDEP
jgi:hypothetical protein